MRDFYKDFEDFCIEYSQGTISAYKRGLLTMADALATMLDNKNNTKRKIWRVKWTSGFGNIRERDCTSLEQAEKWEKGLEDNGFEVIEIETLEV